MVDEGQDQNLVLFDQTINHLCRIKRILSFEGGNAMLIGLSGCGKRSIAELAAYINNNHIFKIEITKNYKIT